MKSFLTKAAGAPSSSSTTNEEILALVHAQKTMMSQLSESTSTLLDTLESKLAGDDEPAYEEGFPFGLFEIDEVTAAASSSWSGKAPSAGKVPSELYDAYQASMAAALAKSKAWSSAGKYQVRRRLPSANALCLGCTGSPFYTCMSFSPGLVARLLSPRWT